MTGGIQVDDCGVRILSAARYSAAACFAASICRHQPYSLRSYRRVRQYLFSDLATHRPHLKSSEPKKVCHVCNRSFRLANADCFDHDDIIAGGLADQHRLAFSWPQRLQAFQRKGRVSTNAFASAASWPMRVLSPRIDPPVRLDDGSTANTATLWPLLVR